MAVTYFPSNSPLAVKRWSKTLFEEVLQAVVWYRFMGMDKSSVIYVVDDLEKDRGDQVTYGLRRQLQNDPQVGNGTLAGKEEALVFYNDSLIIDRVRHGVLVENEDMTDQRVPYEVRAEGKEGLQEYFTNLLDTWFFNQLCGYTPQTLTGWTGINSPIAPDTNHHIFVGGNTADEQITTAGANNANLTNLTLIDNCVLKAETMTLKAGTGAPLRPAKINGKSLYVMFVHPQQAEDIRTNTNTGQWLDIAKALIQGGHENLFAADVLGLYHNTLLVKDFRVTNGVVSTSSTTPVDTVRRAAFCGSQAICFATGRKKGTKGAKDAPPIYWREDMRDYENQIGIAANMIAGMKKTQFSATGQPSFDYGVITVSTYSAT